MIRPAIPADIPRLVEMGERFHEAAGNSFEYDKEATASFLETLITAPAAGVFVSESGMIGGALNPAYCNPSYVMAVELFWWSEDRQGLKLLKAFEEWAQMAGADEVRMTSLAKLDSAAKIMARRGYEPSEISHRKAL